ncbi:DoxX family protein [Acuticoccus mangrovi]|uniref:DoxX family protein n=1 Tax=Acuticoccus mangrovi TaxID=2796142 RepID=A0A934MKG0_9HYPH|nr:DoxX family protein [Acuticoccus mangrovi]MBJ3775424.1 DoxX family protein [Acuticoccus mangrovi]
MLILARVYHVVFFSMQRLLEDWLIGTLGRLVFAGVLLVYFLNSALTKFGDGVMGLVDLDAGAYAQILPKQMEAVGYDPTELGLFEHITVYVGTYAELILPCLIVAGFLTRFASLGMIIFVIVMTWSDITQHGVDASAIGSWFGPQSGSLIADQRALWLFLLVTLVLKGPGPISLDALFGRMWLRR